MADKNLLSSYHLADRPDLYEPARNHAFMFVVSGLENLLPAGAVEDLAEDEDYITNAQDVIMLSVASSFVPHFTNDVISIKRGNSTMKFAGAPSFEAGSLVLNDYIGARTKDVLMAWQNLVYDVENDVVNLAGVYKKDCKILEYDADLSRVIRTWILKGCWISGLSESEFSYDDNNKRTITATIQYDRAYIEQGE